ncbi:MAG: DEAD/DEAH box helicase [Myxococcales bacterium]|nr:DEAD/DEAH box helicase [Myxococcales bacterium]
MPHFLSLAALASHAEATDLAQYLDRDLATLFAAVPTGSRARTVVSTLQRTQKLGTLRALLDSPTACAELRAHLGSSGEQALASQLGIMLERLAASARAPLRQKVQRRRDVDEAATAPIAPPAPRTVAPGSGLRLDMEGAELAALLELHPGLVAVAQSYLQWTPIEHARRPTQRHATQTTRIDHLVVLPTGELAPQAPDSVRVNALDRLRKALARIERAATDHTQRMTGPALADLDLEWLRSELVALRLRLHAPALSRPTAELRLYRVHVRTDMGQLQIYDDSAPELCRGHGWEPTRIRVADDGARVLAASQTAHTCTITLGAIDFAIDACRSADEMMLTFAQTARQPQWERLLRDLDPLVAAYVPKEGATEAEPLGWRLKGDPHPTALDPVLIGATKTGKLRTKKVALADVRAKPALWALPADGRAATELAPDLDRLWEYDRQAPGGRLGRALRALVGHPRVVAGDPPVLVTIHEATLRLSVTPRPDGGATLGFVGAHGPIALDDVIAAFRLGSGGVLIEVEPAAGRVTLTSYAPAMPNLAEVLQRRSTGVPSDGMPALLARLDALQRTMPVDVPDAMRGQAVEPDPRLVVQMAATGPTSLRLDARIRLYDGAPLVVPGEGHDIVQVQRDGLRLWARRTRADEPEFAAGTLDGLPLPDAARLDAWSWGLADDAALELVEALQARTGLEVLWADAKPRRVSGTAQLADLRLHVTDRRDWFGVAGGFEIDGTHLDLATALEALRGRRTFVQVDAERWVRISEQLRRALDEALALLHLGRDGVTLPALHAGVLATLGAADVAATAKWHGVVDRIRAAAQLEPEVPATLGAELRPYQREGFQWLARLALWSPGALLCDDMGLGKTVQALGLLLLRRALGPALVVAPTSVVFNWQREVERFASGPGGLQVHIYGTGPRDKVLSALGPGDVVVASYDLVARDIERFQARHFGTLVVDEAQAIKNPETRRAKAICALDAGFRVGLTGTPLENHIGELWSLARALIPGLLGSWDQFRSRFVATAADDPHGDRRKALARTVRPFLLRRLKRDVLRDLPPRTETRLSVELSEGERQLYDGVRLAALTELTESAGDLPPEQRRFQVLAALTRLRQLACHPRLVDPASTLPSAKLDRLEEVILTLKDEGHRALVFSQFTRHLALVRERLDAAGVTYRYLDGSTPEKQRRTEVDAFQAGLGDVFLISLKAGGTGLNLTAADYVLHLDPWWNPAVEDQATDRTHRIGQTRAVTVYRLVARGTIEEAILALHATKRSLVADVLDGSGQAAGLTTEDLVALIRQGTGEQLEM